MKIATIVGARPQFIKAATVSQAIASHGGVSEVLIHTGQHFDFNMSDVFFAELDIRKPDYQLGIGGGTHGQNTGRMIEAIEKVLVNERPKWAIVYGDTDSTLAGTLAAVKLHVPVAHVEAGLRSFNREMPEEINRVLADHAADLLFAPSQTAVSNLNSEGIFGRKVKCVGDVMLDATIRYRSRARRPSVISFSGAGTFVLATVHRAENTNDLLRLAGIVNILNQVSVYQPVVLPLHPRTSAALTRLNGIALSSNVHVIDPVSFLEMSWLLSNCELVFTDSGGVQKEAYFHQKPCIIMREETEWVELVAAGFNCLLSPLSNDAIEIFQRMRGVSISKESGLFGHGDAARKIVSELIVMDR